MTLFLTDLVFNKQKCRFFDMEHTGGNKHRKKGNKCDPVNYRPISLTCICCKIMEHIILSHMSKRLSWNNILIDQQHGFREKFSCETQLISAVHDWAKGINLCQQTDVILLDFSKAFVSVPHERLLTKLDYYGIRGKMLSWIKAFLSNRTQNVSVNGVLYLLIETCGIWSPPGFCLGTSAVHFVYQ